MTVNLPFNTSLAKSDEINSSNSNSRENSESGEKRKINSIQVISQGVAQRTHEAPFSPSQETLKISKVYSSWVKPKNSLQKSLLITKKKTEKSYLSKSSSFWPNFKITKARDESYKSGSEDSQNSSSGYLLRSGFKLPRKKEGGERQKAKMTKRYQKSRNWRFEYFNKTKTLKNKGIKKKYSRQNEEYSTINKTMKTKKRRLR